MGPRNKGLCCIWQAVCQVLKDHCTFSMMSPNTSTSLPTKTRACSVMSNSVQPYRLSPTRLLCPWDSLGKNTGAACHFLLKGIFLTQGWNLPVSHIGRRSHLGNALPTKTMRETPRFLNLQFFK